MAGEVASAGTGPAGIGAVGLPPGDAVGLPPGGAVGLPPGDAVGQPPGGAVGQPPGGAVGQPPGGPVGLVRAHTRGPADPAYAFVVRGTARAG